ncbi:MAG: alpha/beta hydrolase [Gammaproteobacteria bacterium]|nr:alpha/beta hydrolase [Gammaproteobacteria bacterium]
MANTLPRLVFVPGMATDERLWRQVCNQLNPFAVCSHVDLSNCIDRTAMLSQIDRAVRQHPRTTLIGFSMGGYLSTEYILKHGNDALASLVLINCSATGYTQEDKKRRRHLLSSPDAETIWNSLGRLSFFLDQKHPEYEQNLLELQKMSNDIGYPVFMRQQQATMDRKNRLKALGNVSTSTLIIRSERDMLVSYSDIIKMKDALPNATLDEIDSAGHMLPLEQPAQLAESILAWLQKTYDLDIKGEKDHVSRPSH